MHKLEYQIGMYALAWLVGCFGLDVNQCGH